MQKVILTTSVIHQHNEVRKVSSRFLGLLVTVSGAESEDIATRFTAVKRLCVEKLIGPGTLGSEATEIAIASLFTSKRFTVTENCTRADAILKGAISQSVERRVRGEAEGTDFGLAGGGASGNLQSFSAGIGALAGGTSEKLFSAETKNQATATLRIINREGDVLWAHTSQSAGGKTKSAPADAVDRAIRQLIKDMDRSPR